MNLSYKHLSYCLLAAFTTLAEAAELSVEIISPSGKPVGNAVITLTPHKNIKLPDDKIHIIDQINKTYVPHVKIIPVGSKVSFPNKDNIQHHVYSFSDAKKFELPLYEGTPTNPVTFNKPGIVALGCNIHDWMLGYVYVTDDPWFAVSDAQGKLNLEQLPAGTYTASLWHPQAPDMLPQAAGQVQLTEAGSKQRFTLTMQAPASQATPSAPASAFGDAFKKARDAAQ